MSFIGGDIARNEVCAAFVRNTLTPILERVPCAWIWCHHTGKPPRDAKAENAWTNNDYSYYGIGGSDLSNAVRAIAIIRALDNDVYEFRLTKRERRAGLSDADGRATTAIRLEHSAPNEGSYWRYSDRAAPKEEFEQQKIFSPKQVEKYENAIAILRAQPQPWRDAIRLCETIFELKERQIKRTICPELKRRGLIQTADGVWTALSNNNEQW